MANAPNNAAAASTPPRAEEAPDPLLGRTIDGRYEIVSVLARGGMGKVYKARHVALGRLCAVKVLHANLAGAADTQEFHARFFQEASVAAKLSHPNTVKIFDYGCTSDKVYYMAMEFLEGRTLYDLIRKEAPLPVARAVHIARQVCRSLREAHAQSIVHRDLKPGNVFLTTHDEAEDFVKLLDFGLVKNVAEGAGDLTQSGIVAGTPKYMAPEQIRGETVCAATDVYSLGVVLYEMLTGKAPFAGKTSLDTLKGHLDEAVPAMEARAPGVSVPADVQAVVFKCLGKEIGERYPSMDELLGALKAATGGGGTRETAVSLVPGVAPVRARVSTPPPAGSAVQSTGPRAVGAASATASAGLSVPPSPVVPRGNKQAIVWASALGIALVLGVGATVGMRGHGTSPAQTPGNTERVTQGTAADARVLQVALESTPSHAQVFENNVFLGTTPLRVQWTGERADPSRVHTFTFRLPGYHEETATLSGPVLVHAAALQPEAPAPTASAPAAGNPGNSAVRRAPVRRGRGGGRDHNNDFW